jgi:hypothetical protein
LALQYVSSFGHAPVSAILVVSATARRPSVALTLRLDALAVCAAFVFVGAILLGAF